MTAADIGADFSLAQYREREDALFAEVRATLEASIPADERVPGNRYWSGSPNHQWHFATDWNHTFELTPAEPRGGALLLHGLTDSPYSLRAIARALHARGYYVLAAPTLGKTFSPTSITSGGTGTAVLTLTLANTNAVSASLSNPAFTDVFPVTPGAMRVATVASGTEHPACRRLGGGGVVCCTRQPADHRAAAGDCRKRAE